MHWLILSSLIAILATAGVASAQENHIVADTSRRHATNVRTRVIYGDPTNYAAVQEILDKASRPTFGQRLTDRLRRPLLSTTPSDNFDISATAGIGYTQETNLSVAAAATGLFRINPRDTLTPQSDVTVAGSVSVTGFYRINTSGKLLFRGGQHCLAWNLDLHSLPVRFWGLGYEAADTNPRTQYTHKAQRVSAEYMTRIVGSLFAGVSLDLRHAAATSLDATGEQYLAAQNQPRHALSTGIGFAARLDTRDCPHNATQGIYIDLLTEIRPQGLGDCGATLWHITATADWYHPLWYDAVVAVDLYADLWSSATPWLFWPSLGGASRLRGYYTGRYTDRKMVTAQVELRQHIYGPIGACVWGGAANVCASHKLFDWSEILPNYGLGVRLALGQKTALRIDYGFGRHSNGLVINVNEAF